LVRSLLSGTTGTDAGLSLWGHVGNPREIPMRIPALAILTISTILTAAPARAQTYGTDYPVCLQVYGRGGGYIACRYTSLAQCAQSASGRSAQCIINPYFAGAHVPADDRRHRRVY
jgi:hypothetical protein